MYPRIQKHLLRRCKNNNNTRNTNQYVTTTRTTKAIRYGGSKSSLRCLCISIVDCDTTTSTTSSRRITSRMYSNSINYQNPVFGTTTTTKRTMMGIGDKLRVAIVGGGCAGLSAALHLAELVDKGYIAGPIDLYVHSNNTNQQHNHHHSNTKTTLSSTLQSSSSSIFVNNNPRDTIGIGLWSTALQPFYESQRSSHQFVYHELTNVHGTYNEHVGYRTPNGQYLLTSTLPNNEQDIYNHHNHNNSHKLPGLLFLREIDMIQTLQKALHVEEQLGTVRIHRSNQQGGQQVYQLHEQSIYPYSTQLVLSRNKNHNQHQHHSSSEDYPSANHTMNHTHNKNDELILSERDYHFIIAADGTHSQLRKRYGGHDLCSNRQFNTGTSALGSSSSTSNNSGGPSRIRNDNNNNNKETTTNSNDENQEPLLTQQQEAVSIQDRHYTVFRGNATISREEMDQYDAQSKKLKNQIISFQTWGTHQNMRFATVPMVVPSMASSSSIPGPQKKQEQQVWFITIENDAIKNEMDPMKRREMLLYEFRNWHDPIKQIIQRTLPENIIMDQAIAHKHNVSPILSLNRLIQYMNEQQSQQQHPQHTTNSISSSSSSTHYRPPNSGDGPIVVFHGDAYMTVDPILAQGCTMAMEGSYSLKQSIERAISLSIKTTVPSSSSSIPPTTGTATGATLLAFQPQLLQEEIKRRHYIRMERLICLLRSTELVQALGQPSTSNVLYHIMNTKLIRPIVQYIIPNWMKRPIFNSIMKYSLGLGLWSSRTNHHYHQKMNHHHHQKSAATTTPQSSATTHNT